MAEAATLPEITVAAAKPDDTDYLTPALAKVFATYGQDTTTPAVQAEIATTAQRLRDTNPDADDKTLVTQLSANLPQVISSVSQTPRVSSGADEQAQLASYKQQVQKDAANAGLNTITAYGFKGNAGNDYVKNMQDLSFNPSSALMSQIKADDQFYKNQQSKGLAQETAEKAAQAGIKTISDRQQLAQTQNLLDPTSDQNQSLREALTQQLKQMGAPASAIARMANMNAVQMKLFEIGRAHV